MKKRIGFIAMSGIRAQDAELLELGLTLPGFVERSKVIASLPSLSMLTLAALTPAEQFVVEYHEILDLKSAGPLPGRFDLVAAGNAEMHRAGADPPGLQLEEIGAAEAAPAHAQEDLAIPWPEGLAGFASGLAERVDRDDSHNQLSFHQWNAGSTAASRAGSRCASGAVAIRRPIRPSPPTSRRAGSSSARERRSSRAILRCRCCPPISARS